MPIKATGKDDPKLFLIRRDLSGGTNTRIHKSQLAENQSENMENVDLGVPGERTLRPGLTQIADLGALSIAGVLGFDPVGGSAIFVAQEGTNLKTWDGASPATFTTRKSDFTASTDTTIIKAYESGEGDVVLVKTDSNNWFRMNQSYTFQDLGTTAGTGSDSPPASKVAVFFQNRLWILKDDLLYYSDAGPADYATAFDTVNQAFRVNVGDERAILGTRDLGLLVMGKESIWAINPSVVPAATDKPEKILDIGVASSRTVCQVGDDYIFLSFDGVRSLKRTLQDKLQLGRTEPISWPLRTQFDEINWAQIEKSCGVHFDGKYFLALPTGASTTNNVVWVYWPSTNSWGIIPSNWNIACWAVFKVNGEERLYAGRSTADGLIYRAWSGTTDNGTVIAYLERTRNEDFGDPLSKKSGGEITVLAKGSGDYNITVKASFDDSGFNTLGTINVTGSGITFPLTFPVKFGLSGIIRSKFHTDEYGSWHTIQLQFECSNTPSNENDIVIYEHHITAYLDEYDPEESSDE